MNAEALRTTSAATDGTITGTLTAIKAKWVLGNDFLQSLEPVFIRVGMRSADTAGRLQESVRRVSGEAIRSAGSGYGIQVDRVKSPWAQKPLDRDGQGVERPWQQGPARTQISQTDRCDQVPSGDSQAAWAATPAATKLAQS